MKPLLSEPEKRKRPAKARRTLNLLFLLFVVFGGASAQATNSAPLEDGTKVPDLKLTASTGEKISLAGYARQKNKKNLLLIFFRTGTCAVCIQQLLEIAQASRDVEEWNTVVLALSVDDAIVHSATSERIEKRFPLLLDPDAKAVKAFGVFNAQEGKSFPAIYLVGPDRKVLYHYVGKHMNDRPKTSTVLEAVHHYSGLAARKNASQK